MRLIKRDDTSLAVALIVGAVILFHQPLRALFDLADAVERQYHLDLVPALVVLTIVFGFHQYRKRQEAKAEARAAATEAAQARLRSEELERLVGVGRALSSASDFSGVSQALVRYVQTFTGDRAAWVLIYRQGCWDVLVRDAEDRRLTEELEASAERMVREHHDDGEPDARTVDDLTAFPLMAGTRLVGALLVANTPPLATADGESIEALAALMAIAIRNVQTLIETRDHGRRDGLTGCFNRAYAIEALASELRRTRRISHPMSIAMFDVDRFKSVNDEHGHLVGDRLLAEIGRRLGEVVRTSDVKCRYGGDEFLVILPDTPGTGARQVGEALRQALAAIRVPAGDGRVVSTNISVGLATVTDDDRDAMALIGRADRALYRAKQLGRNCVYLDEPREIPAPPLRLVARA